MAKFWVKIVQPLFNISFEILQRLLTSLINNMLGIAVYIISKNTILS